MRANELTVNDVIEVIGFEIAIVTVEFIEEDEKWVYATDINGNEYEWRENEEIEIIEHNADPYNYIHLCDYCKRPAHLCACP